MTKGLGLRQYRACVRCRSRKTRCELGSIGEQGKPPCAKCAREGAECVLAPSRRGGDFSHHRRKRHQTKKSTHEAPLSVSSSDHVSPRLAKPGEDTVHDSLQNPSDALLILAHAAGQPEDVIGRKTHTDSSDHTDQGDDVVDAIGADVLTAAPQREINGIGGRPSRVRRHRAKEDVTVDSYPLIKDGTIDPVSLVKLLRHYADNYHPFFPIVPASVLRPDCILKTIQYESFLLTTILVVASKDRPDLANVHKSTWNYMRKLILDVVLGMASVRNVGCVEGLLLLGEWTSLNTGQTEDGGEGAAWSILGLAVRLAYLLRLEDSSFKGTEHEADASIQRERLAWTFTYLSDRQISIRMGQAFWCRGPALSARFTASDFPALQPKHACDEDFASLLQAQVELTTLFGNVHDILFASRSRTAELMMRGDYTKYVDDAIRAMLAWQRVWKSLAVSPHLKSCLTLMQEYLRLYVNAFAFQAVLYRASVKQDSHPEGTRANIIFPDSTMASPDARHIYEAVDAAESLLKIVTEDINPEQHFRYMPARFYLYEIHSSVFLFKAHASGAISSGRYTQTAALVRSFITFLSAAAVDENHTASKYAKLLERLWFHRPDTVLGGHENVESVNLDQRNMGHLDPSSMLGLDLDGNQIPFFEDIGLPSFDCADTMDGLFAMPPVFGWDQSNFLDGVM